MSTLYELTDDLLALEADFLEKGGELSDEELDVYLRLQEDLEAKLDRTAAFVRELEARAKMRKEEAARLSTLARSDEALAFRLKERMMAAMQALGKEKVETPRFRLSVRTAGGKQAVVLKVAPEELPLRFQRQRIEADLDALRAALEAGDQEALEVAELAARKRYLSIR